MGNLWQSGSILGAGGCGDDLTNQVTRQKVCRSPPGPTSTSTQREEHIRSVSGAEPSSIYSAHNQRLRATMSPGLSEHPAISCDTARPNSSHTMLPAPNGYPPPSCGRPRPASHAWHHAASSSSEKHPMFNPGDSMAIGSAAARNAARAVRSGPDHGTVRNIKARGAVTTAGRSEPSVSSRTLTLGIPLCGCATGIVLGPPGGTEWPAGGPDGAWNEVSAANRW